MRIRGSSTAVNLVLLLLVIVPPPASAADPGATRPTNRRPNILFALCQG
jgi:hypothetical protein